MKKFIIAFAILLSVLSIDKFLVDYHSPERRDKEVQRCIEEVLNDKSLNDEEIAYSKFACSLRGSYF